MLPFQVLYNSDIHFVYKSCTESPFPFFTMVITQYCRFNLSQFITIDILRLPGWKYSISTIFTTKSPSLKQKYFYDFCKNKSQRPMGCNFQVMQSISCSQLQLALVYQLQSAVVSCCQLQSAVVNCGQLQSAVASCSQLQLAVVSCSVVQLQYICGKCYRHMDRCTDLHLNFYGFTVKNSFRLKFLYIFSVYLSSFRYPVFFRIFRKILNTSKCFFCDNSFICKPNILIP